MQRPLVHAQDFNASWPGVLDDMLEFIVLTQLSLGRGRSASVQLSLSRDQVPADQLQPHVDGFRARLAQQAPNARVDISAAHLPHHRVEMRFAP